MKFIVAVLAGIFGAKSAWRPIFPPGLYQGAGLCRSGLQLDRVLYWFGTIRAGGGVLVTPRVLFYATGGLAYGQVNSSETISGSPFSSSQTRVGYTVGGGIEGAIGGDWTAKLEYLFVDLGGTSGSFATAIPASGGGAVTSGTLASNYSSHVTDNVLRFGVNYNFR